MHTHAATINPTHYESLNPDLLGRSRKFSLDQMSGLASVRFALRQIEEPQELAPTVLEAVKAVSWKGKVVEFPELRHIVDEAKHRHSLWHGSRTYSQPHPRPPTERVVKQLGPKSSSGIVVAWEGR